MLRWLFFCSAPRSRFQHLPHQRLEGPAQLLGIRSFQCLRPGHDPPQGVQVLLQEQLAEIPLHPAVVVPLQRHRQQVRLFLILRQPGGQALRRHGPAGPLLHAARIQVPEIPHLPQLRAGEVPALSAVVQSLFPDAAVDLAGHGVVSVAGAAGTPAASLCPAAGTECAGHPAVSVGIAAHRSSFPSEPGISVPSISRSISAKAIRNARMRRTVSVWGDVPGRSFSSAFSHLRRVESMDRRASASSSRVYLIACSPQSPMPPAASPSALRRSGPPLSPRHGGSSGRDTAPRPPPHPGRVQPVRQSNGHHQAHLRPVLPPPHRQRCRSEQMPAVKADLAFLHLDGSLRKRPVHPPEQRFIQRQLRRMAVEEHPRIRCAVLRYAHSASPLPAS